MFFIEHGRVEVVLPNGSVVRTLQDGMYFGGKHSLTSWQNDFKLLSVITTLYINRYKELL